MPLAQFDTPGHLRDAPANSQFYKEWHRTIDGMVGAGSSGAGGVGEFYNPTRKDVKVVAERALVWMGFPRRVMVEQQRDNRSEAFRLADERTLGDRAGQEEYCEWRATRQGTKIDKVTITTEVPEYWETLFAIEPDIVVTLYRELTGNPSVVMADLVSGTQYNRLNRWNTTDGIVHLAVTFPLPNTLDAAVGLAKNSGIVGGGTAHFRDNYELQQGTFQVPTSADPRVTMDGNTVIRRGPSVTLRDPIGLYIAGWDDTGWTKPDGSPVGNYWRVVRGSLGAALRVEYEVPMSEGFLVGDIRIGGRPIEFGGQIAEHLTVIIAAVAGTPRP